MLMNAPVVYTAATSSLHVQTPSGPTAVHATSISMEMVKTASTLRAGSIKFSFGLDYLKQVKDIRWKRST